MSTTPFSIELHVRHQSGDAVALPAHVIRMCCEGFRLQMDRVSHQSRLAPVAVLGSFVALAMFTLLFSLEVQTIPMLECFIGMVAWIVIFYGLSWKMQWKRSRSASLLQAGRMNAWLAMLSLFVLSVWHVVEQQIRAVVIMLAAILGRLRACLRIRLGLIDFNLTAFRRVPPEATHA
ncbi:hypothetical protein [Paraburkholderia gardini]|uniref:Uncharacterized protein n=1 Tax=Paraburkholderia gardini TaxID=2823469 RepID=A0ABM8U9Z8_9BURK|nr:hypothetical protein [Paraburkholderia gardini]CAG4921013.1 hypothetical protein R54767_04771 [Paraburkholderia gardini]